LAQNTADITLKRLIIYKYKQTLGELSPKICFVTFMSKI